jgi:hypothetical protein
MTKSHASLRALYFAAVLAPAAMLATGPAQAVPDETFTRIATIPIPGNPLLSFDISFVDPVRQQYLLADRSNKSLDVFSSTANTLQFQVDGFVGFTGNNDTSGPDGVVTVNNTEAWVGDGDSTVKVINLNTRAITDTISTGGTARADELCFNPRDQQILIANDADTPPFVTFISTKPGHAILAKIPLPNATNGLEQCIWRPDAGLFYLAVPEINHNVGHGEIAVFDPKTLTLVNAFPQNCEPAGLALGPKDQAMVGCNDTNAIRIINLNDGSVVQTFPINGADEAWFNPGDGHYFVAAANNTGGAVLAVIDSVQPELDQTISTAVGDHSVAAEPLFNHVFVPLRPVPTDPACTNGCIAVYGAQGISDPSADVQVMVQSLGGNIGN